MARVKFLKTFINTYDFKETLAEMEMIIETKTIVQHVVINANKINLMEKNPKLLEIINHSPLVNADGKSIVWANRLLNKKQPVFRVTGIDLFEALIELSAKKGYRVYYLGAKKEVLETLQKKHKKMYPELQIAGCQDGYFNRENSEEIAKRIRESKVDILFVAFPSPEKELWLDKYKYEMSVPLLVGVGGSFDVVSGEISRAPLIMQNLGLEWFYRWIKEPKRLFKRYFFGNFLFVFRVFLAVFFSKNV